MIRAAIVITGLWTLAGLVVCWELDSMRRCDPWDMADQQCWGQS